MQGQISAGGLIVGGMIGQRGAPGNGIVSITYKSSSGLEDTYEVLYTNGETDDIVVTNGAEGNGISSITKTSSVGLVDTYTILYTNGSSDTIEVHNGEKGDKGDTGATGATPNLTIGSVTKGADASATITGTTDNPVLNLVLPKGDKGDKGDTGNTGATGNGIYSVTKTGTADLVDTYTILYTNGETTTFTITNGAKGDTGATGNGISTITKTGTAGLVDTYTITYTNGNTDTFEVTNGADGSVTDVLLDGESVVENGVAEINGLATQAELDYYKTIYNVLPKVNGEGETLSLNNTGESILKMILKGNTSQFSTTGKNLLNESSLATYTMNGLTWKYEDSKIKISGQASSTYSQSGRIDIDLPAGTYTFSKFGTTSLSYNCWIYNSSGTLIGNTKLNNPVTINEAAAKIELFVEGLTSGNNYNEQINAMVSTSGGDYEPYTNGASPNPDYPQQIHEVSGDNEINIEGKNLASNKWEDYTMYDTAYAVLPIHLEQGATYVISATRVGAVKPNYYNYGIVKDGDKYSNFVGLSTIVEYASGDAKPPMSYTIDSSWVNPKLVCYVGQNNPQNVFNELFTNFQIQLEKSSVKTDYMPYNLDTYELDLGTLKMRGIGTYEDYFVRNSGKNLFDKDNTNIINGYFTPSTPTITSNANHRIIYIPIQPNTAYTIQKSNAGGDKARFGIGTTTIAPTADVAVSQVALENSATSQTITTNSTANYLVVWCYFTDNTSITESELLATIQIEKGSSATTYEPFGSGQWCKYNAVGSVVLDGTNYFTGGTTGTNAYYIETNIATLNDNTIEITMSNMFGPVSFNNRANGLDATYSQNGKAVIRTANNTSIDWSDATKRTNWLAANTPQLCYIVAKPYLSPVEDTTLISQLDAIEKALSKDNQTNITQENYDKPFKIYASALMKISGE